MNRFHHRVAAAAGLAVIAWVGAGYLLANPLALAVTLLIAALYVAGVLELRRFGQATEALAAAVDDLGSAPAALRPWLERVPASLRNAVRRRVEGEPVALPGPALAPTLAGLLVLLGMLGTFLGMILTLRGTGAALETATDLVAVRNSLIAPVKGLGLAFGTSVAGVAGSAALGLLAALGRRERAAVVQRLDACIATTLRPFSAAHRRDEALALQRRQADQMPALVDALQAMMATLERQSEASGARLLAGQERFQAQAAADFTALARSVDRTLQGSLAEGARLAGEAIRPVAEATLAGIAREAAAIHAGLADATADTQRSLADATADAQRGLAQAQDARAAELLATVRRAHADLQATASARDRQHLDAVTGALQAVADTLRMQWQQAGERSAAQQQRMLEAMERGAHDVVAQAEDRSRATLAEIGTLVRAAAEAPRAAAEVIGELRRQLSDSLARDNGLLDERARVLATLATLLDGLQRAAGEQRGAIDAMVAASAAALERVGERFDAQVRGETSRLAEVAARIDAGAAQVAGLGETLAGAVQAFGAAGERLGAHLERIDAALGTQMARGDEQLEYYVAQAREVIDLSILSQKQIIEELQRLAGRRAAEALA